MLENGELEGQEPAWVPGMPEWTTLDLVSGFGSPKPPPLPPLPKPTMSKPKATDPETVKVSQPKILDPAATFLSDRYDPAQVSGWKKHFRPAHPLAWRRFWARMIDVGVARVGMEIIAIVLLLAFGFWPAYETHPILAFVGSFIFLVLFLMLYEAIMLSVFGTTFGKLIFRIRVVRGDGSHLSFREALSRSNRASRSGMFYLIAFPGLTFYACHRAYKKLAANGQTSWDSTVGSVVRCRPVFFLLYILGVILALCSLVGNLASRDNAKKEYRRIRRSEHLRTTSIQSTGSSRSPYLLPIQSLQEQWQHTVALARFYRHGPVRRGP